MNEFKLDKAYRKGHTGPYVGLIQEWICLNGIGVVIDNQFGPATQTAVIKFQGNNNLTIDGVVGEETFSRLINPISEALKPIPYANMSLSDMVAAYAKQHLKQHPREIGGQNKGPWVRHYMKGNEGFLYPWCAGFISSILSQACLSMNVPVPLGWTNSCMELAEESAAKGLFITEADISADKSLLKPGFIFLNRKDFKHWSHTGIVIAVEKEVFHTIEGNTNDDGSAEGYEVCQRIRSYSDKDFIRI